MEVFMKNTIKSLFVLALFTCLLLLAACSPTLATLVLSPKEENIRVGETLSLKAFTTDEVEVTDVTWKSSDTTTATVDENGNVKATLPGNVSIIATNAKGNFGVANLTVLPDKLVIDASDIKINKETPTGYSYRLYESEEAFVDEVRSFFPSDIVFQLSDLKISAVEFADGSNDSFLPDGESLFTVGSSVPSEIFEETAIAGEARKTYSKKIEFTLAYNETSIPFVWETNAGLDTFTLPNEGEVLLSESNFVVSDITQTSFKLSFQGILEKVLAAYQDDTETGAGTISIVVKSGTKSLATMSATQLLTESGEEIPLELTIENLTLNTEYPLEFEVAITLESDRPINVIDDKIVFSVKTLAQGKTLTISPLHLSIARKTSDSGVPENKATALFNYGAEMEVALRALLEDEYNKYNFAKATWSATFTDSASGSAIADATVVNAPYTKRTEFTLNLDKAHQLSFKDAYILAPSRTNETDQLVINLELSATAEHEDEDKQYWGNSFRVLNKAEFAETVYFDEDYIKTSTPTAKKYSLVIGDDFNYHFNGLNYKKYSTLNAVKGSESIDKEAYSYTRMWNIQLQGDRRDYKWDVRSTEVKNSIMMQKVLATDPLSGVVFIGPEQTKGVGGFLDLDASLPKGTVLSGQSRSKTVRFGYLEARVRAKKKGYTQNTSVRGPWYAFWMYGVMSEFDIMEFLGKEERTVACVTHWHNGEGKYGEFPGSAYVEYDAPEDYENEWWTLGIYWDETKVIYYNNGEKFRETTANDDNTGVIVQNHKSTPASWEAGRDGDRITNVATSYGVNTNIAPQLPSGIDPIPYGSDSLKGIMDVPQDIHISTEISNNPNGWGGDFADGHDKLPTWLEVDYVAYYLPDGTF